MKKEVLYNKKSREILMAELQAEPFERITCSFYRYINIDDPINLRDDLYREWDQIGIFGRIYIAKEGINAQFSCPEQNWDAFKANLDSRDILRDMRLKVALQDGESFYKLTIKIKDEIVAYGVGEDEYNMDKVGNHLCAEDFNKKLSDENTVVVDMRILLYCTGGIRCEKASAYLINSGFENVNQLYGGIIQYAHDVKEKELDSKFIGKNFVFDARMGERVTEDVIGHCHQCGKPADRHLDCGNDACHILFIQCDECHDKYNGCCSAECQEFAALPIEEQRVLRKDPKKVVSKARYTSRIKPKLTELDQS